ncbi:alanine--tRNA ligase, partial [Candidatus Nomurabacteria bacterium CG10_big_fil_rev_8_21_14_0_10_03_31_7]
VVDHLKAALFIISDGILPSNTNRGYVLRRLIRRAVRFSNELLKNIINKNIEKYKNIYVLNGEEEIEKEESKFRETLERGLKEFEKGIDPFILATTYGFPIELTLELAKEKDKKIDLEDFNKKMIEHQKLSQTASIGMFKGGLLNHNEKTIRLHTAHHLLLAGLQYVVGKEVKQKGSNITEERLRIDFICDHKLTDEEKKKVEDFVNNKIKDSLKVIHYEMPLIEAEKLGAEMEFGAKYPEIVSVYFIEDKEGNQISKEFCGGPHVKNTVELGEFKILKEEAVSAGVRRIKAILL